MTRTSHRWLCKPGSFDTVHARQLFPSDNPLGIPVVKHTALAKLPRWLVPYRTRIRSVAGVNDGAVHFFLDDYRFETVWARPLKALRPYSTLLTPDFSLYADWPRTVQMWSVYRSRWCGAFWQAQGFTVIPAVSWSTPDSFDFCFLGLEPHGLVAVSSLGVDFHHPLERRRFVAGFREMIERLSPSKVLCYGRMPDELHDQAEIVSYPTRWQGVLKARRHGGNTHGW